MNRKLKLVLISIIPVLVVAWFIFGIIKLYQKTEFNPDISFEVPTEYIVLFNHFAQENMVLKMTYLSKGRRPISVFKYRIRYSIVVYDFGLESDSSIQSLLDEQLENVAKSSTDVYITIKVDDYNLSYIADIASYTGKIFVALNADSIKNIIKNDSTNFSTLALKSLSIRHDLKHAVPDMAINKNELFGENVNLGVLFLKRNKHLFLILISDTDNEKIDNKFAYEVLAL